MLLTIEAEVNPNFVNVTAVEADGVTGFGSHVGELQEIVRHVRWTRHLARSLQAKDEKIQNEAVILHNERRELEASDDAVAVRVVHVFVIDVHVVLRRHVISNVVVDNQTQQTIQKGQIDLLVQFFKTRLQENIAFPFGRVPHILKREKLEIL